MKVDGTRSFAAPRETVWEVLNDPQAMAATMPGVEGFEVQDDRHWKANVKIPLGLGGLKMSIAFEKAEEREPEYARLAAKGQGVGALMNMQTSFHLSEAAGGTEMRWEADVKIAGPVGSMGQRVLQPIVNQQVQNVLAALDKQIMDKAGAEAVQTGGAGPSEGGQAGGAEAVTTDVETHTEPEPKDYGPPADAGREPEPDAGRSGAEEGIHEWSEEAYSEDPEGPTTSTEDRGRDEPER